jgi:hypothetical protein
MTVIQFPLLWARQLIDGAEGPIPEYGSAEWVRLPDESRAKVASCVEAAERWRTRNRQFDVDAWPGGRRAREIEEANRARTGDHLGGPVPWEQAEAVSGD